MSAPTPAPGDERPREGYYPDPSIPGYVRYWNGMAWVPGTSRPAPGPGERLAPPAGAAAPAPPAPAAAASAVEETGPVFLDEESALPQQQGPVGAPAEPAAAPGAPGQPAAWGAAPGADPRLPSAAAAPAPVRPQEPEGTVTIRRVPAEAAAPPPAEGTVTMRRVPADPAEPPPAEGTVTMRRVPAEPAAPAEPEGTVTIRRVPGEPGTRTPQQDPPPAEGTVTFRRPGAGQPPADSGPSGEGTMTIGAGGRGGAEGPAGPGDNRIPQQSAGQFGAPPAPQVPGQAGPAAPPAQQGYGYPQQQQPAPPPQQPGAGYGYPPGPSAPTAQAQGGYGYPGPGGPAPAGGYGYPQPSPAGLPQQAGAGAGGWAGDVRRLAGPGAQGGDEPVVPWKPPVVDPFQAAAQAQAAARPAALGRRFLARLIDTLVVGALTAVAAVPLYGKGSDHLHGKIDTARLTGRTVKVWLLDGTTGGYLGIVLAVLLVLGILYEVLPTAKWGRTPGKKLMGLQVRDIEGHEPPSFGAALRRWLVLWVPSLLVIGLVGLVWCAFDRPWRQCWHDKAAGSFVAGT